MNAHPTIEPIERGAYDKGERHEMMVEEAFKGAEGLPGWFKGIEKTKMKLDFEKGIDFVVQSDVGKLFLQVKSSEFHAELFRMKQRMRRYSPYIVVVKIVDGMSERAVRSCVVSALGRMREVFLAKRRAHLECQ